MTFAENKTKTMHDRETGSNWKIGVKISEMKFLGYWTCSHPAQPHPTNAGNEESYEKHIKH